MTGFDFESIPRMLCADGASSRLAELARARGMRRPFIVTDRGLLDSGTLQGALAGFAKAGIGPVLWSGVQADPPEVSVIEAVRAARDAMADGVLGVGGGSSMDTAKLVALLAPTDQQIGDTYGIGLARGPRLPLIQAPTTAGTGSEVTAIAIVTTGAGEKKGVVSSLLYADLAVLDATLTVGLPARATAMTGLDAMVHAIEAYTSRHRKNVLSDTLAHRALALLSANIRRVLRNGQDLDARRAMLQGSMLAGMAFANAPVGAVHALAYPLGGQFHVPHGLSNALVLLPVLEFNSTVAETLYGELSRSLLDDEGAACRAATASEFIRAMGDLLDDMPFERRLRDVGVGEADLPPLARDALAVQRLLVNNPREVTYDDALAIYRSVY
ncbi:MAG: iron-containing alcohol dehydrogenase [Gemmatimonas sp.]